MTTDRPLKPGDIVHIRATAQLRPDGVLSLAFSQRHFSALPDDVVWQHAPEPDGDDGTAPAVVVTRQMLIAQRDEARAKVAALEAERDEAIERDRSRDAAASHLQANVERLQSALTSCTIELEKAEAEVDRMRPVVKAAEAWRDILSENAADLLVNPIRRDVVLAVDAYRAGQEAPLFESPSGESHNPPFVRVEPGVFGKPVAVPTVHGQKAPEVALSAPLPAQDGSDGKTDAEAPGGSRGAKCGAGTFDEDNVWVVCSKRHGHVDDHFSEARHTADATKWVKWADRDDEPAPEWERELIDAQGDARRDWERLRAALARRIAGPIQPDADLVHEALSIIDLRDDQCRWLTAQRDTARRKLKRARKALAKVRGALGDGQ